MNISIRHIQHFIAVAEELHFRRAAQLVNVAQPALSRSVQSLENELGVQLLTRNNRSVKLTTAGNEFLAGCLDVVNSMEATINKTKLASQNEHGCLNIGYTYIAMCGDLPQLIAEFERTHPAVPIEPQSATSAEQHEKLLHEEIDFCFMTGPVDSQEIETALFQRDRFEVIAPKKHRFADQESISLEELSKDKILLCGDAVSSSFNEHVYRFFAAAGLQPNYESLAQNHIGLLGHVALGRGVAIANEGYGCVYAKELVTLKISDLNDTLPTYFAWRKDLAVDQKIIFKDFVLKRIAQSRPTESRLEPQLEI